MIERNPVIEVVHVDLASAHLLNGLERTAENSCDKRFSVIVLLRVRDHGAVVGTDPCGGDPLAKDDVGASKCSTS